MMLSIKQILSVLLWPSLPQELHVLKKKSEKEPSGDEREFNRELKQTTTVTATGTSTNKRFNEQNNSRARALSLYISLPFTTKQQCEMTKFCVFWRT